MKHSLPLNSLLLFIILLVLKLSLLLACVKFISSVSCPLPCQAPDWDFPGFVPEVFGKQISRKAIRQTDRQTDMFVYLESYTINIHRL